MKKYLLILPLILTGCTQVQQLSAPKGESSYMISCMFISNCYKEASNICPSGFDLKENVNRGYSPLIIDCKKEK